MLLLKILSFILFLINLSNAQFDPLETNYSELVISMLQQILNTQNTICSEHLSILLDNITTGEIWALKMLDASAKPQTGILSGNIMHLGNYDECLSISEEINNNTKIQGKYCTLTLPGLLDNVNTTLNTTISELNFWLRISFGLCLPKSCNKDDFYHFWNHLKPLLPMEIDVIYSENLCYYSDKKEKYETIEIVVFGLISLFIFANLTCTIIDIVFKKKSNWFLNLLRCFSLKVNFKKFIKQNDEASFIKCIDGFKVLAMLWILIAHGFVIRYFMPNANAIDAIKMAKGKFMNIFVVSATLAADTFFTLTGMLLVYVALYVPQKGSSLNILAFYTRRVTRFLPCLAMVVLVSMSVYHRFGEGPLWISIDNYIRKPCQENWLKTMLFVQNYFTGNQCIPQAWYLAVDMQLFILSPILLIMLLNFPKHTSVFVMVLIAASASFNFALTFVNEIDSLLIQGLDQFLNFIYYPTHTRMGPWLIGMLCGFALFSKKGQNLQMCKLLTYATTALTMLLMVIIIAGHVGFTDYEYNKYRSSFFNGFARNIWALCIAWLVYLCHSKRLYFLNKVLSLKLFNLLAKLNYNVFLVNVLVILYKEGQNKVPGYFTSYTQFHNFWGDYFYSLGVALIMYLTVEQPFVNVHKLIFANKK